MDELITQIKYMNDILTLIAIILLFMLIFKQMH